VYGHASDTYLVLAPCSRHAYITEALAETPAAGAVAHTLAPSSALQVKECWSGLLAVDQPALEGGGVESGERMPMTQLWITAAGDRPLSLACPRLQGCECGRRKVLRTVCRP